MTRLLLLLIAALVVLGAEAQIGQIKGKVVDAKTQEPLPFGNVFINNTTIGTAADGEGEFILKNIPFGQYELVFSYVGYVQSQRRIIVNKELSDIGATPLVELEIELDVVEVQGEKDKEWARQLKQFEKVFLGDDAMAAACNILNPWVIDFKEDAGSTIYATASAPIEISNTALGYKITFYLKTFVSNSKGYTILGQVRFEEMISGDGEQVFQWQANRQNAYLGSSRHLFKSIIDRNLTEQGFALYTDRPDAENTMVRSPYFNEELGKKVIPYDTAGMVLPKKQEDRQIISLKGSVEVHYKGRRAVVRTYRDVAYPVSWIEVNNSYLAVNSEGNPLNPSQVFIAGDMNADRVAKMLPLNYEPPKINLQLEEPTSLATDRLQEKVFVQTDKPYYYPGEIIWLKGYMNYEEPSLSENLSKVMYMELIGPEEKIIQSKMLLIDQRQLSGEFFLQDTLAAGDYYLRAYTNWMRNFGQENFFVKHIPILALNEKIDSKRSEKVPMDTANLITDKPSYAPREKITLSIKASEYNMPVVAALSMSVTDVTQVTPIPEASIMSEFPFKASKEKREKSYDFSVEQGISFKGRFYDDEGKPDHVTLTLIEWQSQNMILAETDNDGYFVLTNLAFYDSAEFSFHAKASRLISDATKFDYGGSSDKDKPYGRVEPILFDVPEFIFEDKRIPVEVLSTEAPQRHLAFLADSKKSMLLKGVNISASKIQDSKTKTLGKVDYVITAKDLKAENTMNLFLALAGKAPGLVLTNDANGLPVVRFARASNLTSTGTTEPLVLIDNMPASGSAGNVLQRLNADMVERVELSSGLNVLYGSQAVNGVISIFTKEGGGPEQKKRKQVPMQVLVAPGFARPKSFDVISPELATGDVKNYNSTIYWEPNILTNRDSGMATVSFSAADFTTRYRVVVEGITENNTPIRYETYISIGTN
ncbi:MAG: carboxypeptidase-like regulatory domain-containing protein [Cyclobacteriaceae bacterium]